MGCFLACFGASKDRRRRRQVIKKPPIDRNHDCYKPLRPSPSPVKPTQEVSFAPIPDVRENHEDGSFGLARKKVTFDMNVKTYDVVVVSEDPKYPFKDDEEKGAVERGENSLEEEDKPSSNVTQYPANHRYQNCEASDDEDYGDGGEEDDYENSDFDDEDEVEDEEESYDSFFSLPMEKERQFLEEVSSRKPVSSSSDEQSKLLAETKELDEIISPKTDTGPSPQKQPNLLAHQNARDRSQYVHSVLNPVENISQWREVKVRAAPVKHQNKENVNSEAEVKMKFDPEPAMQIKKPQKKSWESHPSPNHSVKSEISVDASLSTWLVTPEVSGNDGPQISNSNLSNSSMSREEQPILGALTIDDLKQSVTSSPRKSPSRNPDEIPIVGTVGSYWSCKKQGDGSVSSRLHSDTKGIPNTTSKYREDKRVNWHSTPFEVRLERALEKGAAEA